MNEDQIRAAFEKAHPNYGGKAWIMLEGTLSQESFVKGYKAAMASQVNNMLPNQEPLGSEFEKVLYDNLDSLYETATAPQHTNDRVRELEAKILDLPRYSFLSPKEGGVRRYVGTSGAWIERWEVIKLLEAMKGTN